MISAKNIRYSIEGKEILHDISFDAEDGEFITLIGPNGCGKSTFLKIMARIIKPTSGSVKFMGRELSSYKTKELARDLAILPQSKNIPADVTVEQLVQYGRYPYTGLSGQLSSNDYSLVDMALEETGMKKFKSRKISTLSGGESQMAWIAMAIAQTPKLLFLDEPTTYLDICYQLEVLELVKRLNRELKLTTVLVLHDINQASQYSDRIYAMKAGSCYTCGKVNDVLTTETFKKVFSVKMKEYDDGPMKIYLPKEVIKEEK